MMWRWLFGKRKPRTLTGTALGCRKSPKDKRDFAFKRVGVFSIPEQASLKGWTIKQQGKWNSCSAHAICTAAEVLMKNEVPLSERFNWYQSREAEDRLPQNSGVYLRTALKTAQAGIAPETLCPYAEGALNTAPDALARGFARFFRIGEYSRCANNGQVRDAIASGYPVVIGMDVDTNFQAYTGGVYKPGGSRVGGHAMVIVGYDYDTSTFTVVNSWGTNWGERGTARIPFKLVDDGKVFEAWAVTRLKRRDEQ